MLILCLGILTSAPQMMFAQGAQKHKVTGTVTDENGDPLIGVTVAENGTTSNGVITDFDGNYSIDVSSNSTLTFSYVGYLTQNIKAGSSTTLNVTMKEDNALLDEVVVVP